MSQHFSLKAVFRNDPHLLADSAELSLCFGGYDQVSEDDLLSIIRRDETNKTQAAMGLRGVESTKIEQEQVEDCFRALKYRVSVYGDDYPFKITAKVVEIKEGLGVKEMLYLFLLVCSRLGAFSSKLTNMIASEFELLSKEAMYNLMPKGSDVYVFGANSSDRKTYFNKNLTKAIPILAKKANFQLTGGWETTVGSSGDGKLDVIGINDFPDKNSPSIVMLGQCAARATNWSGKRYEADFNYHKSRFHAQIDPVAVLFIPVCYRQPSGNWVNSSEIDNVIAIDRQRMLHLILNMKKRNIYSKRVSDLLKLVK